MKIVGVTLAIAMIALTAQAMVINDGTGTVGLEVGNIPISSDQTQTESEIISPYFDYKNLPDVSRLEALVGNQEHLKFESIGGDIPMSASFPTAMGIAEAGYDEIGLNTTLQVVDEALDNLGLDVQVSFENAPDLGKVLGKVSQVLAHPDTGKMTWELFTKSQAGKLAAEIKKGIDNGTIDVKDNTISAADLTTVLKKTFLNNETTELIEKLKNPPQKLLEIIKKNLIKKDQIEIEELKTIPPKLKNILTEIEKELKEKKQTENQ